IRVSWDIISDVEANGYEIGEALMNIIGNNSTSSGSGYWGCPQVKIYGNTVGIFQSNTFYAANKSNNYVAKISTKTNYHIRVTIFY
ncbi:MAG: hypothetical protein LBL47_04380, partial [Lactobacillus sp.]|nr:hypothetical protein [Lactobacillus sp.]